MAKTAKQKAAIRRLSGKPTKVAGMKWKTGVGYQTVKGASGRGGGGGGP